MTRLERLLVWCGGADPDLIASTTSRERARYASIGFTVLTTAAFAAAAGAFALETALDDRGVALACGLIWGAIVLNIDRYVVASLKVTGKLWVVHAAGRVLLAVVIGVAIAKPLELRLFQTEIDQRIAERIESRLQAIDKDVDLAREQIEAQYVNDLQAAAKNPAFSLAQQAATAARDRSDACIERQISLQTEYLGECDGSRGSLTRGDGRECERKRLAHDDHQRTCDVREVELATAEAARKTQVDAMQTEHTRVASARQAAIETLDASASTRRGAAEREEPTTLLARHTALGELADRNTKIWLFTWFITGMVVLIDIAPVLAKLASPAGPYDALCKTEDAEHEAVASELLKARIGLLVKAEKLAMADAKRRLAQLEKHLADVTYEPHELTAWMHARFSDVMERVLGFRSSTPSARSSKHDPSAVTNRGGPASEPVIAQDRAGPRHLLLAAAGVLLATALIVTGVWTYTRNVTTAIQIGTLALTGLAFWLAPVRDGKVPSMSPGRLVAGVILVAGLGGLCVVGVPKLQDQVESWWYHDKTEGKGFGVAASSDHTPEPFHQIEEPECLDSELLLTSNPHQQAVIDAMTEVPAVSASSPAPSDIHAGRINGVLAKSDMYLAEGRFNPDQHLPLVRELRALYRIPGLSTPQNERLRASLVAMNELAADDTLVRATEMLNRDATRANDILATGRRVLQKPGKWLDNDRIKALQRLDDQIRSAIRKVEMRSAAPERATSSTRPFVEPEVAKGDGPSGGVAASAQSVNVVAETYAP